MDIYATIKEVRVAVRLLDLPDAFDEKTLRKAYKEFARNWHPDAAMQRGLSAENANKMMAEGNKAYRLLKQRVAENGGTYRVPNEPQTGGETSVGQGAGYSGSASSYGSTTSWEDETGYGSASGWQSEYQNPYAEWAETGWEAPSEPAQPSGGKAQSKMGSEPTAKSSSVIAEMFESIREPIGDIGFWTASFTGKILRLIVHGFGLAVLFLFLYAFADLTLPLDNLTPDAIYVSLFQDVILLPMLIFILGLAYVGIWVYRGIARFIIDLGDSSSIIALVFDVILIVAVVLVSKPFIPMMRQAVNYVFSLLP